MWFLGSQWGHAFPAHCMFCVILHQCGMSRAQDRLHFWKAETCLRKGASKHLSRGHASRLWWLQALPEAAVLFPFLFLSTLFVALLLPLGPWLPSTGATAERQLRKSIKDMTARSIQACECIIPIKLNFVPGNVFYSSLIFLVPSVRPAWPRMGKDMMFPKLTYLFLLPNLLLLLEEANPSLCLIQKWQSPNQRAKAEPCDWPGQITACIFIAHNKLLKVSPG